MGPGRLSGAGVVGDASHLSARNVRSGKKNDDGFPEAAGGRKEYTDAEGKVTKVVEWFGYKFHLLVNRRHEVALAYQVSSTKAGDNEVLPELVEQALARRSKPDSPFIRPAEADTADRVCPLGTETSAPTRPQRLAAAITTPKTPSARPDPALPLIPSATAQPARSIIRSHALLWPVHRKKLLTSLESSIYSRAYVPRGPGGGPGSFPRVSRWRTMVWRSCLSRNSCRVVYTSVTARVAGTRKWSLTSSASATSSILLT